MQNKGTTKTTGTSTLTTTQTAGNTQQKFRN